MTRFVASFLNDAFLPNVTFGTFSTEVCPTNVRQLLMNTHNGAQRMVDSINIMVQRHCLRVICIAMYVVRYPNNVYRTE